MDKLMLIIGLTGFLSCATTRYVSIDVMKPAQVLFPSNIVQLAVVDNAGDSLSINDKKMPLQDRMSSMSKTIFATSLAQFMDEEHYFNKVQYYPKILRNDRNFSETKPLAREDIQQIAKEIDADAILSIQQFVAENTKVEKIYGYTPQDIIISKVQLTYRIYTAKGDSMSVPIRVTDSLHWMGYMDDKDENVVIYKDLALHIAENTANFLIPHWQKQDRRYFTDGTKFMKEADKFVKKGDWFQAATSWGKAFTSKTKQSDKRKIAHNIAIANEVLNDIPNALVWINISRSLITRQDEEAASIKAYRNLLINRTENKKLLKKQLIGSSSENKK